MGGGVVEHHVQHDANAALMRLGNQRIKIVDRAVRGVDLGVVGNVVAVIDLRGNVERCYPEGINAELLQIVET